MWSYKSRKQVISNKNYKQTYQYLMVNEGTKSFTPHSLSFRSKILDRIKIGNIYTTLIWTATFRAKLLDIHSEKAYIYSFNLLKQYNNLK